MKVCDPVPDHIRYAVRVDPVELHRRLRKEAVRDPVLRLRARVNDIEDVSDCAYDDNSPFIFFTVKYRTVLQHMKVVAAVMAYLNMWKA